MTADNGQVIKDNNKMGYMPENKLLLSMAWPLMASMLVQAMYNIVDSLFVARYDNNALTAISLAFPLQNLIIAFATGTGVGINALLSKSLGEKNLSRVNKTAGNGLLLATLNSVIFLVFGLFFCRMFFESATDIREVIDYGVDYLSICCLFSFGLIFEITFERILQATGRTSYTMFTQGLGAVINIILDPLLIFGLLGFPEMGIRGAAIATVIGQIVAAISGLIFNVWKNRDVHISLKSMLPDFGIIKRIYIVGIPSIIMVSISSIMTLCMNQILMAKTKVAVDVLGVYFKLQSFVFMPVFGLNNSMVPIIAYNYGARKPERITKTMKLSIIYACSIMLLGLAVLQIIPGPILSLFDANTEMMKVGKAALRIISISYLFAGFCIIATSVFQALGNGILSLFVSLCRQLVVLLPVAFLMSYLFESVNAVWWAFPIAELVSVVMCVLLLRRIFIKQIRPLSLTPQ